VAVIVLMIGWAKYLSTDPGRRPSLEKMVESNVLVAGIVAFIEWLLKSK
jgi:hypothetical protein